MSLIATKFVLYFSIHSATRVNVLAGSHFGQTWPTGFTITNIAKGQFALQFTGGFRERRMSLPLTLIRANKMPDGTYRIKFDTGVFCQTEFDSVSPFLTQTVSDCQILIDTLIGKYN